MDFIKVWPYKNIYDTKVSSYVNKALFTKNILKELFETTEVNEKLNGLGFKFDEKHEMVKYMPPKPKPEVSKTLEDGDPAKSNSQAEAKPQNVEPEKPVTSDAKDKDQTKNTEKEKEKP